MALHDVKFTLPERPLGKVDIDFNVEKNGEILGCLKLSKGGVDWYSKHAKTPHRVSWTKLARLIEEHGRKL